MPGFVWNRVQFAVVRECLHLLAEGVASAEDIDRAVRDGYALRTAVIGPFETMDVAGLDLFGTIAADLFPALSDADEPPAVLTDAIAAGRMGVESGAGIFEYDEGPAAVTARRDDLVAAVQAALDAGRTDADGPADAGEGA